MSLPHTTSSTSPSCPGSSKSVQRTMVKPMYSRSTCSVCGKTSLHVQGTPKVLPCTPLWTPPLQLSRAITTAHMSNYYTEEINFFSTSANTIEYFCSVLSTTKSVFKTACPITSTLTQCTPKECTGGGCTPSDPVHEDVQFSNISTPLPFRCCTCLKEYSLKYSLVLNSTC